MNKQTILELIGLALENGKIESSICPVEIGKSYLIRTVTLYYTGRVKEIRGKFFRLEEAAWIADTGRFAQASAKGEFNEIEPFANDPWINSDAIIDAQEITYKLPTSQK